MHDQDTEVLTVTFPLAQSEQTLRLERELAATYQQTQANLAGQLAKRSERIYRLDVAAFLW